MSLIVRNLTEYCPSLATGSSTHEHGCIMTDGLLVLLVLMLLD
jgi:hypothetical protein